MQVLLQDTSGASNMRGVHAAVKDKGCQPEDPVSTTRLEPPPVMTERHSLEESYQTLDLSARMY